MLEAEVAELKGESSSRADSQRSPVETPAAGGHRRQLAQVMINYIETHYQRPLHLNDVAAELRMNASYLSAIFTQAIGCSFHQYRDDLRLAKAKQLLRDAAQPICEVACAVGFASADSFRRAFLAHEGIAPRAWRAKQ